jgi:hypothetical protein
MTDFKHYRTTISNDPEMIEALHKLKKDWDLDSDSELVFEALVYTLYEEEYL